MRDKLQGMSITLAEDDLLPDHPLQEREVVREEVDSEKKSNLEA
jgi:hypothetical protein